MPVMCTVQLPKGKKREVIDKTLADLANVLMNNLNMQPNQVRVSICELPRNRFMAGGILAADMPEFDEEDSL